MILSFTLDGPPQPKQRARIVPNWRTRRVTRFTPKKTRQYERAIKNVAAAELLRRRSLVPVWPLDARYRVEVSAFFGDARRRDADNVGKACCDALNGILWNDDSQIVTLTVNRAVDRDCPRTEVRVEVLP